MKQPVLVTGAAGFIGSHLSERLLHSGQPVIGLDNFDNYYPVAIKRGNIRKLESDPDFQLIEGDIRDSGLLAEIFHQYHPWAVMHLAARAGVRPSVEDPFLYQDVNIKGTLNLLHAARNSGISRFIFASSSSVYGSDEPVPFREAANVNHPVSPYAASKASAELFCRTYNHLYGLSVMILRLFTVYGPRQRPDLAIHRFTRQILDGEEVTIFGNGSMSRDYTYIDDIVDGFLAAMNYQGESFRIFNLGGGRVVSLHELVRVIETALGRQARIKYADPFPGDVPITMADISRARELLGYRPKFSIEEGIRQFVRWYLECHQPAGNRA